MTTEETQQHGAERQCATLAYCEAYLGHLHQLRTLGSYIDGIGWAQLGTGQLLVCTERTRCTKLSDPNPCPTFVSVRLDTQIQRVVLIELMKDDIGDSRRCNPTTGHSFRGACYSAVFDLMRCVDGSFTPGDMFEFGTSEAEIEDLGAMAR